MSTQPISNIIRIDTTVSPRIALRNGFDTGLIIGTSDIFKNSDGTPSDERTRIYHRDDVMNQMMQDGFAVITRNSSCIALLWTRKKPNKIVIGVQKAGEKPVDALQACYASNKDWYIAYICGLDSPAVSSTDIDAIAKYMETIRALFFYNSSSTAIRDNLSGNILEELRSKNYSRTLLQYSTEEDAVCAIMGYALGANTGLANSAYTLKFKREIGITPEDISAQQVNDIFNNFGNVYLNYADTYDVFQEGTMVNGIPFDSMINLDMLVYDMERNIMDLLVSVPKVPQTEAGVTQIIARINQACPQGNSVGFLAANTWNGESQYGVEKGDLLIDGYRIVTPGIAGQSQTDRDARKSPPIYVYIKEAGAIHSVIVGVNVER